MPKYSIQVSPNTNYLTKCKNHFFHTHWKKSCRCSCAATLKTIPWALVNQGLSTWVTTAKSQGLFVSLLEVCACTYLSYVLGLGLGLELQPCLHVLQSYSHVHGCSSNLNLQLYSDSQSKTPTAPFKQKSWPPSRFYTVILYFWLNYWDILISKVCAVLCLILY